MISDIVNMFQTLFEYVELIWDFFLNLITMLMTFIQVVIGAVTIPQQAILYMPAIIAASVSAVYVIAVVKVVIGR